MVKVYRRGVMRLSPSDRTVSLSRRGLEKPRFRITRASTWGEDHDPWKNASKLPVYDRGLGVELAYADAPVLIEDLPARFDPDDPMREHFEGMAELRTLPQYERGVALNTLLVMQSRPGRFEGQDYADALWRGNLFGWAVGNLVLRAQLAEANQKLEREMRVVGEIQRSLLPESLPRLPGVELAASYVTSAHAGGDSYDVFELPDGKLGLFISDVSGHGTPAAVMMAVTHAIAHTHPGPASPPSQVLGRINRLLARGYTRGLGTFVTAFYGVFDPSSGAFTYAGAGHNPPRLCRASRGFAVEALDAAAGLPLGIDEGEIYDDATIMLGRGDTLLLYTDGITEAFGPGQEQFGVERLDASLRACPRDADDAVDLLAHNLETFTHGAPPHDDRTLLLMRVTGDPG
jgi:sigma-B regulation protein RsbU (phosphoserine phosphatase)